MKTEFELKILKERYHFRDLVLESRIILKCTIKTQGIKLCIGLIWHRAVTGGVLL
jgi:hypothetical protein